MPRSSPPCPKPKDPDAERWFMWAHRQLEQLTRMPGNPRGRVLNTTRGRSVIPAEVPDAGITGWHWHDIDHREYSTSVNYVQDEVVIVSPSHPAVTIGYPKSQAQLNYEISQLSIEDPDPDPNNYAKPGRWVYVGAGPSRTADPGGDSTKDIIHLPQWPLPDDSIKDPVTNEVLTPVAWELISLGPILYVDCEEGLEKHIYVNAAELREGEQTN